MDSESRGSRVARFAKIFISSRYECGKSQEFMAAELGVSRKTVQNWEKGLSSPSFFQATEWFRVLGLNPIPYYLEFIFPHMNLESQHELDSNEVSLALHENIDQLTDTERRQLLYLLTGRHGSSPSAVLHLLNAHLQTPIRDRFNAAHTIYQNYVIEKQMNNLVNPDDIQPDLDLLKHAIEEGRQAIYNGNTGYSSITRESDADDILFGKKDS